MLIMHRSFGDYHAASEYQPQPMILVACGMEHDCGIMRRAVASSSLLYGFNDMLGDQRDGISFINEARMSNHYFTPSHRHHRAMAPAPSSCSTYIESSMMANMLCHALDHAAIDGEAMPTKLRVPFTSDANLRRLRR